MQNSAWVALLRHIPVEQHNQFSLVTVSGTEITVQILLRIEEEFVALKGRLAGSQDAGRAFFIPYANIDYFGTSQPIKDADFNDLFGSLTVPSAASPLPSTAPASPPAPAADPPAPASGPSRADSAVRPSIRSEVLDRYRGARPASSAVLPSPKSNGT